MSGETEAQVSGWTVDTLREYLIQRLVDVDRLLSQRMDDADKAITAALSSAEKAVGVANQAAERRFAGVNEFRQQQQDLITTFMPRAEHESEIKGLEVRVTANAERLAALELRLTSRLDLGEGSDRGTSAARGEQRVTVSQVIAALAVVAAVVSIILYAVKK